MTKMWLLVTVSASTGRPMGCPGLAIEFMEPCLFETKEEADYIIDKYFPELTVAYEVSVGKVDKETLKKFYNAPKRKHAKRKKSIL